MQELNMQEMQAVNGGAAPCALPEERVFCLWE